MQKISFDWLDMKHNYSIGGYRYSLLSKDEDSESAHWHSSKTRATGNAEDAVRHFMGKDLPKLEEMHSDCTTEFKKLSIC